MASKVQELLASAQKKLQAVGNSAREIWHRNFGRDAEPEVAPVEPDKSLDGLYKESQRRLDRAVNALTNQAVSSSRGGQKREKKKVVTSKTYKPQLGRF